MPHDEPLYGEPAEDEKAGQGKPRRKIPTLATREPFWWAMAALVAMGAALVFVILVARG